MTTHTYTSSLHWSGSTADYDIYSRRHTAIVAGSRLELSAAAAFRGDDALPNPEQLLVAATSSCQMLSFLAVAAYAGVEVLEYRDDAVGVMPEANRPTRITEIVLRPHVVVAGGSTQQVQRLLEKAHQQCYIANTLTAQTRVDPTIEVV